MADLIPSILAHALGGVILAYAVWAVGLGLMPNHEQRTAAFAYPFGLLAVTVAATLTLLTSWLAVAAALLVVVPLLRLVRLRPGVLREALRSAFALPAAVGFGTALGWIFRPPTAHGASGAYGDFVFYAQKLQTAAVSIVPFHD